MGVDGTALWSISYGMYVVTARAGGGGNGQIANTAFQVSAQPPRIAVAINKENFTHQLIRDGGWFGQHCPLVTNHAISISEARVVGELDAGTHTIFVGDIVSAEMLTNAPPLTYALYHARKGRAPRNAPTYQAEPSPEPAGALAPAAGSWVCGVCGYVYDPAQGDPAHGVPPATPWENLPDDWVCPVCGSSKEEFSAS
jgi:rubredoxin/flavin reductase (DIM6/NTAB) family NADH-FMN oxidoreductase RutF